MVSIAWIRAWISRTTITGIGLSHKVEAIMAKRKEPKPKLVHIEWCDACSQGGWKTREQALAWVKEVNWVIRQVGWILDETDEYILISDKCSVENLHEEAMFNDLMKIPKTWIRKRKVIKL